MARNDGLKLWDILPGVCNSFVGGGIDTDDIVAWKKGGFGSAAVYLLGEDLNLKPLAYVRSDGSLSDKQPKDGEANAKRFSEACVTALEKS